MDASALETEVAARFRLKRAPTLAAEKISRAPIIFSRLQCERADHGRMGPMPASNSFGFQVVLRPCGPIHIWSNRRHTSVSQSGPGDTFLFSLTDDPQVAIHDRFDLMRFYISQSSLDSLAYENGLRNVGGLRAPKFGVHDSVMHGTAIALSASMIRPNETQTMFVEYMALAFHAHVSHVYAGSPEARRYKGGLSSSQLRRTCDAMQEELEGNHSISRLASECGLSSSHFARAFKETTGLAPHQWLTRRRVERARMLLSQTTMGLADIALACGFVDQSHFSRVFARIEKQSPGRWRRQLLQ